MSNIFTATIHRIRSHLPGGSHVEKAKPAPGQRPFTAPDSRHVPYSLREHTFDQKAAEIPGTQGQPGKRTWGKEPLVPRSNEAPAFVLVKLPSENPRSLEAAHLAFGEKVFVAKHAEPAEPVARKKVTFAAELEQVDSLNTARDARLKQPVVHAKSNLKKQDVSGAKQAEEIAYSQLWDEVNEIESRRSGKPPLATSTLVGRVGSGVTDRPRSTPGGSNRLTTTEQKRRQGHVSSEALQKRLDKVVAWTENDVARAVEIAKRMGGFEEILKARAESRKK